MLLGGFNCNNGRENNRRNNDSEDGKSKVRIKQIKMNENRLSHC